MKHGTALALALSAAEKLQTLNIYIVKLNAAISVSKKHALQCYR